MPPHAPETLTIHLVRHGETDWNRDRRIQGGTDIPLNGTGTEQARRAAAALAGRPLGAVISSDLSRARDTAAPIAAAAGVELQLEAALRERHHGIAEGRSDAELQAELDGRLHELMGTPDFAFPGGESRRQVHARLLAFLDPLLRRPPAREFVLVSHAGSLRVARAILEGFALEEVPDYTFPNGEVISLEVPVPELPEH